MTILNARFPALTPDFADWIQRRGPFGTYRAEVSARGGPNVPFFLSPDGVNVIFPAVQDRDSSIIECSGTEHMLGELNPCGGGDSIPLLHNKLLVGRRSSCDICLAFPNVSSHHCELELQDGFWHVRDLGSTNGIKVNGERTLNALLMPGDELQVAKSRFRIQYRVDSDAPVPEGADPFAMSLMQKAGLEKPGKFRMPESSDEKRKRMRSRRRANAQDDFIMDWLSDE